MNGRMDIYAALDARSNSNLYFSTIHQLPEFVMPMQICWAKKTFSLYLLQHFETELCFSAHYLKASGYV